MRWTKFLGGLLAATVAVVLGAAPGLATEVKRIVVEGPMLSPGFKDVGEGDLVSIDVTIALEKSVLSQFGYEGFEEVAEADEGMLVAGCPYGALSPLSDVVQIPTGDTHFLLSMRFGDPHSHAANLASCEYKPGAEVAQTVMRFRGCFLALTLSVPTARHVMLHPLPAIECRAP